VLLVIFGAGASYDSVPHLPPPGNPVARQLPHEDDRPPLANELFENREHFVEAMQRFQPCMAIVPFLRKKGVAVEEELARLQLQAKTFPRAHQELAAIRYYLHFALWECQKRWSERHRGITNYATFLREVERWRFEGSQRVCFVTFNYDTMLEQAMEQVLGYQFDDFSRYVSRETYSLIKLHGSISWGWEIDALRKPRNPNEVINAAADLKLSEQHRRVSRHPMLFDDGSVGFPAISIPVHKKDEFACPREHVEALARLLPNVTKIITIGWRASEEKFLAMLTARLTGLKRNLDLLVVSGSVKGARETIANLGHLTAHFSTKQSIEEGFTGLIHHIGDLGTFLRK
jgi:hypothetical protein